jgi:hypothetical protein
MAKSRPGTSSLARIVDSAVRQALAGGLGPSNYGRKSIGMGEIKHDGVAGAKNDVYCFVPVNADGDYDVPHKLGAKPVHVELVAVEYPDGAAVPHASCQPVRLSEWTSTSARVNIALLNGGSGASLTGCVAKLRVRGA